MADAPNETDPQPPVPQPAQPIPPPVPPVNDSTVGNKPPLPTTLSNAQNLIDTALATRKMSVKENPTLQMKWEQMYARLLQYKEKHGNCLVPNRYKEDRSLGQWVSAQRRQYKQLQNGEDSPMTKERAAMLEGVGFVWATLERGHVPWEVRYQELMAYKQKHGDALVPIGYKENPQLSSWVSTQRQEMKLLKEGRPTRLTEERIHLLNDGGFVWESQRGKRGGRKKKRKSTDPNGNNGAPASPSAILSHARPSTLAARVITDSDSSLPPLSSSSGGEVFPTASARIVTDPGQFDDGYVEGAVSKKRETTSDSLGPPAPALYSVHPAPPSHQPAGGIFDDADEGEDLHTAAAVDTYFKAQRKRPSAAVVSHMSDKKTSNGGPSHQRADNVALPPPPRLAHRKVTCCDAKPGSEAPAPKNNSQEQSQQEAAVALLSVGRAMA